MSPGGSGHDAPVSDADEQALIRRFRTARRDPDLAVLEGFHALKHALRFGGEVLEAVAADPQQLRDLTSELAPDLGDSLSERTTPVPADLVAELVPQAPRTGVVAIARRPGVDLTALLAEQRPEPLVLLEDPRTMGNMGACVRVAAAADAAGVLTTGSERSLAPRCPARRRGAPLRPAGRFTGSLFPYSGRKSQESLEVLTASDRPLVAIDPGGEDLRPAELPPRAILAFGTERYGLSAESARASRCSPRHPDARGRLQPQPGDRRRRGSFRAARLSGLAPLSIYDCPALHHPSDDRWAFLHPSAERTIRAVRRHQFWRSPPARLRDLLLRDLDLDPDHDPHRPLPRSRAVGLVQGGLGVCSSSSSHS